MKKKQIELIRYFLNEKKVVSSTLLAQHLGVSPRTVKTYVKEINQECPETLLASTNGYSLDQEKGRHLLKNEQALYDLPNTFEERTFYYVMALLVEHETLSLSQLEETLFISESTIRSDFSKMNHNFGTDGLRFAIKSEQLLIFGEEKDKRRLVSKLLFAKMPNKYLDLNALKRHFAPESVDTIAALIHQVTDQTNYYANDFSYTNLLLHLLILVEAIQNGQSLHSRAPSHTWLPADKAELVNHLIADLEQYFDITMNAAEREEMHVLFQVNINYLPSSDFAEIKQIVGTKLVSQLEDILEDVWQTFGIELRHTSFVNPFALHLSGLISRAKEGSFINNPITDTLKRDYGVVYMIGGFISMRITNLTGLQIPEDEIAYLALHIGSALEEQRQDSHKIKTVLLCPQYMDLNKKLYQRLQHTFATELTIKAVVSTLEEAQQQKFDLLLTTVALEDAPSCPVIRLSPIFNQAQQLYLGNELSRVRLLRKRKLLLDNFDSYFDERFFFIQSRPTESQTVLKQMCDRLEKDAIVSDSFYDHVCQREQAANTNYGKIAIPHSIYPDAISTKIAIVLSETGIRWGQGLVHIVLLPAFSRIDWSRFLDIYEALISLFDEEDIYLRLSKVRTFADFKALIRQKFE